MTEVVHTRREQFQRDGFLVIPNLIEHHLLEPLREEADRLQCNRPKPGVRRALPSSAIFTAFAQSTPVKSLADDLLGGSSVVVRSILFDKTPDANWDVPWHQDVTIAVERQIEVPGFGPWSMKAGVPHVKPPQGVLQGIATIRIHLDPCPPENGALLVVPGSHARGLVAERDIIASECDAFAHVCAVPAGGVVVMSPLTFHASRKSINPERRRVLHLEFSATHLPGGLAWTDA
jgi:ectoine hydroxylase-related dioxygenase (phytanoyl-CoA dioxygenase family)